MEWGKLSGGGGRGGLGREGKQALLKTKENKLRRFCFAFLRNLYLKDGMYGTIERSKGRKE
jgi:hypothetical protein